MHGGGRTGGGWGVVEGLCGRGGGGIWNRFDLRYTISFRPLSNGDISVSPMGMADRTMK